VLNGYLSLEGWCISSASLATLYNLASNPDSAGEAMKLLHELQTYQVEMDLQHEQLMANDNHNTQKMSHYRVLFQIATIPCLLINTTGNIIDANKTAMTLFSHQLRKSGNHTLSDLINKHDDVVCADIIKQLEPGGGSVSCLLSLCNSDSKQESTVYSHHMHLICVADSSNIIAQFTIVT
jgi:PAS domain-containing protein